MRAGALSGKSPLHTKGRQIPKKEEKQAKRSSLDKNQSG